MAPSQQQMLTLLGASERQIARRAQEVFDYLRDHERLGVLTDLLAAGKYDEAMAEFDRGAAMLAQTTTSSYLGAAKAVTDSVSSAAGVPFAFDATNRAVVAFLQNDRSRLIEQFTTSQGNAVRAALVLGTQAGENPRQQALRFRDAIGLTDVQVTAAANYEAALRAGSRAALSYELSSGNADRSVAAALRAGRSLTESQVNSAVDAYRRNSIRARAESIGRTEALRAVHEGVDATWSQAIAAGDVDGAGVVRIWTTARDKRVRSSHVALAGQERAYGETFLSGLGNALRFPGDSRAPIKDTAQCRCIAVTRFRSMRKALEGALADPAFYELEVDRRAQTVKAVFFDRAGVRFEILG